MKKADNFDASKWLVENKITFQSRLNENEEFSDDFPSLDYNTITNFIKSKGYKITSYYYDGGFDVNDGEYFIGVFDDHIAVTDGNGQVKDIPFNESRLNESINNNDLKLYYDILMDVGDEDLAGEYKDIQVKANNFNSISDFIKYDLEILSQDDEDQVNEIKTNFVAAKLRKMSPQEFTDFVTKVGDYDIWSDAPNNIDPFNNVGDRMDVLSTNETEDTNRYFNALIK
jgi:hypothetical protein